MYFLFQLLVSNRRTFDQGCLFTELDFRVGRSSWVFELDFRVG